MEDGALTGIGSEERVVVECELKWALDRIKRLEQLLGQKTQEVECLGVEPGFRAYYIY